MFREIRTAIYERLQTLTSTTDDTKPLSLVYEYPITKVEGFPCAMIGLSDSTAEFNSTRENFRTYNFKISVLQTYQADDVREDNEGILMDCFDRIVELFDSDWDLGGIVDKIVPSQGPLYTASYDKGTMLVLEINLACQKLVDIG